MANKRNYLCNSKNPNDKKFVCPVCGSELIASRFKDSDRHLLVCPNVDKKVLTAKELEHYKKSVTFTASEVY